MQHLIQLVKKYREIIAYLFWGVMTTLVSWGTYSLFAYWGRGQANTIWILDLEISMVVLLANVFSWICAFLFAFFVNKLWVFRSKSWEKKIFIQELWKFFTARVVTGLLEIVAVPVLVGIGLDQTIFGIEGMLAKIIVSVVIVLLNYIFSKFFIFK